MKIVPTTYINDGPSYYRGMKGNAAKIESQEDYDHLWASITSGNFYGESYFDTITGHGLISFSK
jgi:hypothetical protein